MGGDRFWTRESVVTYRLNRTFLRRTLSVGAAIALMGGVLPAAWAEPGTETSNQGGDVNTVEVGATEAADDVLVTIPGNLVTSVVARFFINHTVRIFTCALQKSFGTVAVCLT